MRVTQEADYAIRICLILDSLGKKTGASEIADIAGIPFVVENNMMIPLTIINEDVLKENAPVEIVSIANEIIKNMESL